MPDYPGKGLAKEQLRREAAPRTEPAALFKRSVRKTAAAGAWDARRPIAFQAPGSRVLTSKENAMATFLSKILSKSSRLGRATGGRPKSVPLAVEQLDDRIVPAGVTYHYGNIIPNVQVEPIFYGSSWNSDSELKQQAQSITSFWQYLTNSSYMDELGQYYEWNWGFIHVGHGSTHGADITGDGPTSGTVYDNPDTTGWSWGNGFTTQDLIRREMLSGKVDMANQNTLYIVYLAPGVQFNTQNGALTSAGYYGYHDTSGANDGYYNVISWVPSFNYAVLGYPGSTSSYAAFPTLTWHSTHEFSEAVTDPDLKTGWFGTSASDEIGDRANRQVGNLNGYNVQYEWSNADNATALWEPWGQHVLYQGTSVPWLVGSTFFFNNGYSYPSTLQVLNEDFNSGFFSGLYANAAGAAIPVVGVISGTTTTGGTTTSTIWFQGSQSGFTAYFYGSLTGSGAVNPSGWQDSMTGTLLDYYWTGSYWQSHYFSSTAKDFVVDQFVDFGGS
jgi:hypothetical protein